MGLFGKKKKDDKKTNTKCKVCDLELHQPERLERHMKKAHGNVPEKKPEFSTKVVLSKAACGKIINVKFL